MIAPRSAETLAALPWAPIAADAVGLPPLAVVQRALCGLAERGVVVENAGTFATTRTHDAI